MTDAIDTSGWSHVSRKPWFKDRRYTEVWVSKDGKHWRMLGMDGPDGERYALVDRHGLVRP